ncbi:MerR family transcriptional regulator [Salinisphaera orenii MK-B5]|uniref:Mercuric resistance operon regulatory protein n=1 Tax=Salinisphaera orenii MK-B5 TaxID=856730 RepID=A0A423PGC7_9GAMM|nr:Hg(II)-responsive transcriptional regulator [Salinisphaera orenii]ROO24681.1 MerR family transcriptional regulator [Salinisphaera orenii MK-B5]
MAETGLTIGKLAAAAGVNLQTVRYYQRRGLIDQPPKPSTGYRRYPRATVDRIRFIKRAQGLGFSLDEIGDLLILGDGHCDDVRRVAENQRALVAARIADLTAMQDTLDGLIDRCRNAQVSNHCPLIKTLSHRD